MWLLEHLKLHLWPHIWFTNISTELCCSRKFFSFWATDHNIITTTPLEEHHCLTRKHDHCFQRIKWLQRIDNA